jgi:hypothetical protein
MTFGDIESKLDVLHIECTRCPRKGRYRTRNELLSKVNCAPGWLAAACSAGGDGGRRRRKRPTNAACVRAASAACLAGGRAHAWRRRRVRRGCTASLRTHRLTVAAQLLAGLHLAFTRLRPTRRSARRSRLADDGNQRASDRTHPVMSLTMMPHAVSPACSTSHRLARKRR